QVTTLDPILGERVGHAEGQGRPVVVDRPHPVEGGVPDQIRDLGPQQRRAGVPQTVRFARHVASGLLCGRGLSTALSTQCGYVHQGLTLGRPTPRNGSTLSQPSAEKWLPTADPLSATESRERLKLPPLCVVRAKPVHSLGIEL